MSLDTGAPPPNPTPEQRSADLAARPRKAPRHKLSPLVPIGATIVAFIALAAIVSFFWTPFDPLYIDYDHTSAGPGVNGHWLGTDRLGRDIATRLMIGARTALYVGIVAVGIAMLIGAPLGVVAGMTGRSWSEFIMRSNDVLLAFPALLLAIVLAAKYGGSITTAMIAIGVASIPGFVRVIRSGTLRVMSTDYVLAARVAGRSSFSIAVRHVLPNVSGLLIVQASSAYAIAILAEAGLSFLGLGAPQSVPSWGRMLYEAQSMLTIAPLTALWPGLAIALVVLGFNLLGDGLRDRLDPTLVRYVTGDDRAVEAPLLQVRDLTISADGVDLVRGVSFSVGRGERVGLIGSSGSGKTITCLAVAGLLPAELPVTGSIRLAGVPFDLAGAKEGALAPLRGERIGMVFQEPMTALNPTMRVGRQVAEVLLVHRTTGRRQAPTLVTELLAATGLDDPQRIARSYPHQLSGGQRQRVVLAIALANSPDLLICDEPTTALDVTVQARVLDLIDRRVRDVDAALLFVSHNLAVIAQVCDRVLVMHGGEIVEEGSVVDVLTRPRHPRTVALLADAELTSQ